MDRMPIWTKIVVTEACESPQSIPQNWVRGDNGWFNLDNFVSVWVGEYFDNSYEERGDRLWQVIGFGIDNRDRILKSYKTKERAYAWLNKVMEEVKND